MKLRPSRALAITFVVPIISHVHLLLGALVSSPLFYYAGLNSMVHGVLDGNPTIDPDVGAVDQALTARAVETIASGSLPWWNPYEAFGGPLAGEMQCSALFPLSFLIAFPGGSLVLNIVLQILAGIGLLLLLLRLRLAPFAALAASVVFETSGTFVWMAGGGSYSIPFLPWLVLGVEMLRGPSQRMRACGSIVTAASLAMLIYAGDIETAYLEGLGALLWAIVRLSTTPAVDRLSFLRRMIVASIGGLAIASPIVVAFVDMLAVSNVGIHDGSASPTLPLIGLIQKFVPYVYGPIFSTKQPDVVRLWGDTGGYVGFLPCALGLAGTFGRNQRPLRVACAAMVVFGFSAMFGGPLLAVVAHVPGVRFTAYYRYVDPLVSFGIAILAGFALDDLIRQSATVRRIAFAAAGVLGIIASSAAIAWLQVTGGTSGIDARLMDWRGFSGAVIVLGCTSVAASFYVRTSKKGVAILGAAVMFEAITLLLVPTLGNAKDASIDLGGVAYLQQHLGLQRYYTLGPLGVNYGSYFGIASLAYADVPIPQKSVAYIKSHLDWEADPVVFVPQATHVHRSVRANFVARLDAFAAVGVRYVLSEEPLPASPRLHVRFHNATMYATEIDGVTPYASAPSCTIEASSRTSFVTHCLRPSRLCRLELDVPGWEARVGGVAQTPRTCGQIFESVRIPAGPSTVEFSYEPPYMRYALSCAALAGFWFVFKLRSVLRSNSSNSTGR